MTSPTIPTLVVENLTVTLRTGGQLINIVEDASFSVAPGESLGLVGESGSGKTMTAMALMGLLPPGVCQITNGSIRLAGRELAGLDEKNFEDVRGREIGMIFQDPMSSLDPCFTVGDQIAEVVRRHRGLTRQAAWAEARQLLDLVRIPAAAQRINDYPHTFSGGMRQRVMIAIAIACQPKLLIADEPTTALDVTVQAQILELIAELRASHNISVILVSHDLAVINSVCDRFVVMYAGQIIEHGACVEVFRRPRHPYTAALLASNAERVKGEPLAAIPGNVPLAGHYPEGCRFHPRCSHRLHGLCDTPPSPSLAVAGESLTRCVRHAQLTLRGV